MKTEKSHYVLHIAPTPFFSNRGCHIRIKNIVDALRTINMDSVVCTYPLGDTPEDVNTSRTIRIPGYSKRGVGFSLFKFPADILLFFLCIKIVWKEKPTLIYGHLHEGGLIGWALKILFFWRRISLVMDMQGSLSGELKSYGTFHRFPIILRVFRALESLIYKLPDFITCSSPASRELLIEDFSLSESKSICVPDVIGNGFFAIDKSEGLAQELKLPTNKKIVLYSGSLLQGKGVDVFYEAMKMICEVREDFHFLLVGYPIEGAQDFIDQYGLNEHCTLTGEVAYSKLAQYLTLGDIAIDPKENDSGEASGKILHYMAAALPVVCFDLTNNRTLLAEHGYYSAEKTSQGLAETILEARENPDVAQERGRKLKDRAEDTYSVASSGQLLSNILADI